jgi:hypothetical protein
VKNQYFGDNKDLFTYDLIMQIMQAGLVEHFTFIPMLTENDGSRHGGRIKRAQARAGTLNSKLMLFLDECVREEKRSIEQLSAFFEKQDIKMTIYKGNGYFSHQERQKYFKQIGSELLSKSLAFVDPDIGLEVRNSGEKHILYSETKNLYDRMDNSSILMLYQHFPREEHAQYLHRMVEILKEKISGDYPVCIDNDEIIFFFLTKDKSLEDSLIAVIRDYTERYS